MNYKNSDSRKTLDNIAVVFEDKFPENYKNSVKNWGNFSATEMHQEKEGIQQLLHLDIDYGNSCSLRCGHCFRRDDRFDSKGEEGFLSEEQLLVYLGQAKKLGLKSVKFLGRGEPFENPKFFGFLEKITEMGIGASVFTKGHVIGSDELAKKYNNHYGINSGKDLAERLSKMDVSILLGFNSFDKEMQESYVGIDKSQIKNYVELRDKALINLVNAGLSEYNSEQETRLAIISAPIKPENIDEIFEIYTWGRVRNIYALSCPSTVSGKGIDETARIDHDKYIENLKELYAKIYIWNIDQGLMTLKQFKEEGVSLYPGCHPCTQTAAGMYLTLSGKVVRCPGRADAQSTFTEDIRKEQDLNAVWIKSDSYKRAEGTILSPERNGLNYHCVARDGHSIDAKFYENIRGRVVQHFEK